MLSRITTQDVEPTDLDVALAPRLNVLAGDNGLGKTFLLDVAWFALTTLWPGHPAMPRRGENVQPRIRYMLGESEPIDATFDFGGQQWTKQWPAGPRYPDALAIYTRADGSFRVQDAFRSLGPKRAGLRSFLPGAGQEIELSQRAVWDGLTAADGTVLCNGLIRDWISWQFQRPQLFESFRRVLAKLSPHPDEALRPGAPRRISVEDARDIPTIVTPYGEVPVTHASAGVRRVLALAYVLLWTWHEHLEAARLKNRAPRDELVLLVDEVDAHLHPTWQRVFLPALFAAFPLIEGSLRVQMLASTHAPLVLASLETMFDEARDRLLHFVLHDRRIAVHHIPWAKQGDATNWLVSEAFGLRQARLPEAERAIEAAEAFMRGEQPPGDLDTREKIQAELLRVLPGHDDFWPRWLVETGVVK